MRNASKLLSSNSTQSRDIAVLHLSGSPSSHLAIRFKSSNTRSPHKKPASEEARHRESSPPSLYQTISELVRPEKRMADDISSMVPVTDDADLTNPRTNNRSPSACQVAQEKIIPVNPLEPTSETSLSEQTHVGKSCSEDVSPIVHRITEIVRSEKPGICMERRLDGSGLSFSPEIVEKVLKRCFKVGHLALRFFDWVKLQPGFCHTTETYNTMIYIAGEAEEFDLVERLVAGMDEDLCRKDIKTWTILISHYGKAKQIGKALSKFEEMRKSGCKPDVGVYKAILHALCSAKKPDLVTEFYKEMVSKNMVVDVNLYGTIMNCLARSGNIAVVRSVGDDMMKIAEINESEACTQMLRSLCISGKIEEALQLFEQMKKKNFYVAAEVHEILVKGLCRASRTDDALEMVNNMKQNSSVDSKIFGCLIDGFLRQSDVSKALDLLDSMKNSGCLPMVSSYTQMIQHLSMSDEYGKACELYEDMLRHGIEPDSVAMTAMVAGHVRHNEISEAWKVFENMKRKGKATWKAYTVFIKELCKASKPCEAFLLLKDMSDSNMNATDSIYNLVISSLSKNGELEKVRKVELMWRSFKACGQENESVTQSADRCSLHEENEVSNRLLDQDINSIQTTKDYSDTDLKEVCRILSSSTDWHSMQEALDGCMIQFTPELVDAILRSCRRHGCAALQFFSWITNQSGYAHTADTYNMAIKLAGSGKDFKHMRFLYQEMKRRNFSVTPNTWTIMIAQYGQAGLTEIALKTFKEMKRDGFQPNGSTYKYVVVFLCGKKGRKADEAVKIFQEMIHAGYMPDKETVEIYLSSLCELGKLEDARRSVKSLCKRGFNTQRGYSLLVKSLCRAGRVEEALILADEMEQLGGCSIDQYIYGSLVHALLRDGRLDEALGKVEAMKRAGISQTAHIQTSLIVHYCKEKQIGKAVEVFVKMSEEGCEPTLVTYSALIRGYMNMGLVSDAWEIFRRMKLKGPYPDFQTYSMFMTCLCKAGRSEDAFNLIHEMLETGIIPSAVNFRTVFHGLNREGKQGLAHSVLESKWRLKRERMLLS